MCCPAVKKGYTRRRDGSRSNVAKETVMWRRLLELSQNSQVALYVLSGCQKCEVFGHERADLPCGDVFWHF